LKASKIPGLEFAASDSPTISSKSSDVSEPMEDFTSVCRTVLTKLKNDKNAWPFLQPVNHDEVPEYYDHILFSIDIGTITERYLFYLFRF
jgi:hypothetical protein